MIFVLCLVKVLEEKEEKIAPGTLFGTSHTYVINTGTQDKTGAKRLLICTSKFIIFHLNFHPRSVFNQVGLLRGQKADKVDVTLAPEELELMDNVLPAKYEEAREEKLRTQREDFSDMVAENENKRKRKMQEKENKSKKKFKF